MRRDDIELARANGTDRPGDHWTCSRMGQPNACQFGPGKSGRCPLADQCRPRRTWAGRKRRFSIAFLLGVLGLAVLGSVNVMGWLPLGKDGTYWDTTALIGQSIKPGELTTHHSQILATRRESDRCIMCHPSSTPSLFSWVPLLGANAHDNLTQTDLCLNCHQNRFAPGTASLAHNLPADSRSEIRLASTGSRSPDWHDWLPSPAVDQENIACNACHREHQGPTHSLTALSDAQCQTCHQDRFGDFATSHPEFVDWPYGRGGAISFNHQSHQNKHFPETKTETETGDSVAQFQCAACHKPTADGRVTRAVDYQSACAACHDQSLKTEVAQGIELVSIPTLPSDLIADLPSWPSAATGYFDGKLSPLAQLLIRGDNGTSNSIARITEQDFSRVDPDDRRQTEASKLIAGKLYSLLMDLSQQGQRGMLDRLSANASQQNHWTPVVQSFSPQLIDGALDRWFHEPVEVAVKANRRKRDQATFKTVQFKNSLNDDLLADGDLEGDDLLDSDLLDSDSLDGDLLDGDSLDGDLLDGDLLDGDLLSGDLFGEGLLSTDDPQQSGAAATKAKVAKRFNADEMLVAGGWYRDDIRLAIRYRASGHADAVLKATIEAAASLPPTDIARNGLIHSSAVAACLRCHATAAHTAGAWKTRDQVNAPDQFTTFAHAPHLNIATLSDCVGCHRVKEGSASAESLISKFDDNAMTHHPANDFDPILKQDCASCHTPAAAGDSCVGCHRYHIDPR